MAYISNTTNEIVVDAILTSEGRKRLSSTGKLNITKFALSDDEIDYALYNTSNPNGSDDYDIAIRKLPILEALPMQLSPLKYKLYYDTQSTETTLTQAYILDVNIDPYLLNGTGYVETLYAFRPGIRATTIQDMHNNMYYYLQLFGGDALASIEVSGLINANSARQTDILTEQSKYSSYKDRAVGTNFNIKCNRVMSPANFTFTVVPMGPYAGIVTPTDSATLSRVLYIGGAMIV